MLVISCWINPILTQSDLGLFKADGFELLEPSADIGSFVQSFAEKPKANVVIDLLFRDFVHPAHLFAFERVSDKSNSIKIIVINNLINKSLHINYE